MPQRVLPCVSCSACSAVRLTRRNFSYSQSPGVTPERANRTQASDPARLGAFLRRTMIAVWASSFDLLLALYVHCVVRYGLRGDFLEPVRRLRRNGNHVAFAQVIDRSAFD